MNRLIILFFLIPAFLFGCGFTAKPKSVATIRENNDWKIIEDCGYENCYPLVDFITSKDLQVRIEAHNKTNKDFFIITIAFQGDTKDEYEVDPYGFSLRFKNEKLIPKAFTCSYTIWNRQYLMNTDPLVGIISIKENSCYLLFFDRPPPPVEDNFSFCIEGLYKQGNREFFPEIIFTMKNRK